MVYERDNFKNIFRCNQLLKQFYKVITILIKNDNNIIILKYSISIILPILNGSILKKTLSVLIN